MGGLTGADGNQVVDLKLTAYFVKTNNTSVHFPSLLEAGFLIC